MPPRKPAKVRLLSGGNPQIAKADGDAPVQAYIAAMPGWKRGVGERLDEIITAAVPGVRKAVNRVWTNSKSTGRIRPPTWRSPTGARCPARHRLSRDTRFTRLLT